MKVKEKNDKYINNKAWGYIYIHKIIVLQKKKVYVK